MKVVKTFRIEGKKWLAFQKIARRLKKRPTSLVRELIEEFIEKRGDDKT